MPDSDNYRHRRRRSRSPSFGDKPHERSRSPVPPHGLISSSKPIESTTKSNVLPFGARHLDKHDLELCKPMFELYLDIQKHKVMADLPEHEVKGRWKSFVGKWNRGDLAEGWYDPATLQKAITFAHEADNQDPPLEDSKVTRPADSMPLPTESDEDEVGPTLPSSARVRPSTMGTAGPLGPSSQDMILRRELAQEEAEAERVNLRQRRKLDRQEQKERQSEIVPRAEAGTKERQLEKKRELADSNRAFAASKTEGGGIAEVGEQDLMGDDDGIQGYKRQKVEMERKKNERELRREEILKARAEEREERLRVYREKEEETMSGLVALAKARFG